MCGNEKVFEQVLREGSAESFEKYAKNKDKADRQTSYLYSKLKSNSLVAKSGNVKITYDVKDWGFEDGREEDYFTKSSLHGKVNVYLNDTVIWASDNYKFAKDNVFFTSNPSLLFLLNIMVEGNYSDKDYPAVIKEDEEGLKTLINALIENGQSFDAVSQDITIAFKDIQSQYERHVARNKNVSAAMTNRDDKLKAQYRAYSDEVDKESETAEFKVGDTVTFYGHGAKQWYGGSDIDWHRGVIKSITNNGQNYNIDDGKGVRRVTRDKIKLPKEWS